MLHLADDHLVARTQRASDRRRHNVDAVGGATREDDLLPVPRGHEGAHGIARGLVLLGGLLAQGVDGPVHVGIAALVEALHGLQHLARLLA